MVIAGKQQAPFPGIELPSTTVNLIYIWLWNDPSASGSSICACVDKGFVVHLVEAQSGFILEIVATWTVNSDRALSDQLSFMIMLFIGMSRVKRAALRFTAPESRQVLLQDGQTVFILLCSESPWIKAEPCHLCLFLFSLFHFNVWTHLANQHMVHLYLTRSEKPDQHLVITACGGNNDACLLWNLTKWRRNIANGIVHYIHTAQMWHLNIHVRNFLSCSITGVSLLEHFAVRFPSANIDQWNTTAQIHSSRLLINVRVILKFQPSICQVACWSLPAVKHLSPVRDLLTMWLLLFETSECDTSRVSDAVGLTVFCKVFCEGMLLLSLPLYTFSFPISSAGWLFTSWLCPYTLWMTAFMCTEILGVQLLGLKRHHVTKTQYISSYFINYWQIEAMFDLS